MIGVIIVNQEGQCHQYLPCFNNTLTGIPIRTTLDNATTVQYCGHIQQLTAKARTTVRDLDPTNDLTFLRVRTSKHEIMIAPGKYKCTSVMFASITSSTDKDYLLLVVQDPSQQ